MLRCILLVAVCLVCLTDCPGQVPTDTTNGTWSNPAATRRKGGFGFWTRAQEDSVRQRFVAASGYRRRFGSFYQASDGQCYRLSWRFGIPEGERNMFMLRRCPCLDSASFRSISSLYWADKNGVYLNLSGLLPNGQIERVAGADPASFRVLGCRSLAADNRQVYLQGHALPGLALAGLRVYTSEGKCYDNAFGEIYLVSQGVVYEEYERLSDEAARHFKVPKGYKRAYHQR